MRGGGIFTATEQDDDGNWQWNTGILPSGINASLITTGQLDTNLIRVYAGDKLRFQLNGDGLFAYKSIFDDPEFLNLLANAEIGESELGQEAINRLQTNTGLDYLQYVVHNENGLFLVAKEGTVIKNKDNELQEITGQDINRVEISWNGMRLRNWENEEVFYADADTGDLTLKGTLEATNLIISNDIDVTGSGRVNFGGNTITIDTTNFKLDAQGNAYMNGEVHATRLFIGENDNEGVESWDEGVNSTTAGQLILEHGDVLNVMHFTSEEGLVIQPSTGPDDYWTNITSQGYYIKYGNLTVAQFTGTQTNLLNLKIGDIIVNPTSTGGWAWVDAPMEG